VNNVKLNIATRYVDGLILSLDDNMIKETHNELCVFLGILNNNKKYFFKMLTSPLYSTAEKKMLLDAILKNGKYTFNIILSNFFRVLLKKNRFICIHDIMLLYTRYLNTFLKQLDVVVSTAHKTNKDLNNNITSVLTKVLKSQLKLTHLTDTSLIGGMKIRIENYLLDDTIANKLSSLKKCLINVNVR